MGLTKEEKAALKLAKKLEKAKRDLEANKHAKRAELEREIVAHEMLRDDINLRMRAVLMNMKIPEFRKDMQVLGHVFDRTCDKKNHLIRTLTNLRYVADHQYQRTIASFCETVDRIVNTFLIDLDAMVKHCETQIEKLVIQSQEDKDYIEKNKHRAETHLSLLIYQGHENADTITWTIRGENFVKQDEYDNSFFVIREELRLFLEGNFMALWDEYKTTFQRYVFSTAENQKQLRIFRKKGNMMTDIIASQAKQIAASEGIVRRLRNELAAYESGEKQAGYRDRWNRNRDACFRLKRCFQKGMAIDETRLDRLVNVSDNTIEYLSNAYTKIEKILRLAALCRKLETLNEKVIPFGSKTRENSEMHYVRLRQSEDSLVARAMSSTCGLKRLWERISKAKLSKKALYHEKMLLERENAEMIREIESHSKTELRSEACQCLYVSKMTKKSLYRPHAVDGSLAFRKNIQNYY